MAVIDWLGAGVLFLSIGARWWHRLPGARAAAALGAGLALVLGLWAAYQLRWTGAIAATAGALCLAACLPRCWPAAGARPRPFRSTAVLLLPPLVLLAAIYSFPLRDLPRPTGEHPVGVREFALVDRERRGVLGSPATAPRRLLVRVWYPAGDVEGLHRRPYFTGTEARHTALGVGRLIGVPFLFQHLRHVRTWSHSNAPLHRDTRGLPVAIYSHGYTSFAWQHTALMEELASHGYLVFAIQHTGDSSPTVYPDGAVAESRPGLVAGMSALFEPREAYRNLLVGDTVGARLAALRAYRRALARTGHPANRSARAWLADRRFVIDSLQRGEVPPPVAAVVAAGNYRATAQLGMSFGGSTAVKFCYGDPRCAAAVNLDGADFHRLPLDATVPVPLLMLYSDYERAARQQGATATGHGANDLLYERFGEAGTHSRVLRFRVEGASHIGVSDFTWFARGPVRDLLFGSIGGSVMLPLQNALVLGFLDRYVRGRESSDSGFPAALQRRFRPWLKTNDVGAVREWARHRSHL